MQIKTLGVLGGGLMGGGIAQVAAMAGYQTTVREVNQALLDKGFGRIRKFLDGWIEKGKLTPAWAKALPVWNGASRPSMTRSTRMPSLGLRTSWG